MHDLPCNIVIIKRLSQKMRSDSLQNSEFCFEDRFGSQNIFTTENHLLQGALIVANPPNAPEIIRPLYLVLVRPILEYSLQAIPSYLGRDIDLLERLQRLAIRMVKSLRGLSYGERLRRMILFTIKRPA